MGVPAPTPATVCQERVRTRIDSRSPVPARLPISLDRLDPEILCTHVVDELDYAPSTCGAGRCPRSGEGRVPSRRKSMPTSSISLASLSSRFSRSRSLMRCSPTETPGTWLASIWACLAEVPQRFGTDAEFRAYHLACGVDGPIFVEVIEDHLDGSLTPLGRVTPGHDLHPSQKRKRHQTRHGSHPKPSLHRLEVEKQRTVHTSDRANRRTVWLFLLPKTSFSPRSRRPLPNSAATSTEFHPLLLASILHERPLPA